MPRHEAIANGVNLNGSIRTQLASSGSRRALLSGHFIAPDSQYIRRLTTSDPTVSRGALPRVRPYRFICPTPTRRVALSFVVPMFWARSNGQRRKWNTERWNRDGKPYAATIHLQRNYRPRKTPMPTLLADREVDSGRYVSPLHAAFVTISDHCTPFPIRLAVKRNYSAKAAPLLARVLKWPGTPGNGCS